MSEDTGSYCNPSRDLRRHLASAVGTEELAHLEIIATMVYRLTKNADLEEIKGTMYEGHFVEHGKALYYTDSGGVPFTATYFQAKDDPITDLTEDMAAEQKARTAYNHLIDLSDDPGVIDTLRFLREREIVHFQRFGEALNQVQEFFACKKAF